MSDDLSIKVTWTSFLQDGQRYLREEWSGKPGYTVWGPISDYFDITAVINERSGQIKAMADAQITRLLRDVQEGIDLGKIPWTR